MVRKILSIAFYVIAGFFLYTVTGLAFVNIAAVKTATLPPAWTKLVIIGTFAVPALISLLIGLAITRFQKWKRDVGIVLVSAGGVTSFIAVTMVCLFISPESKRYFPPDTPDMSQFFGDLTAGIVSVVTSIVLGVLLIITSRQKGKPAVGAVDAEAA
jgi:hypothetical protein